AIDLERTTNDDAREAKAEKLGFTFANIEQAVNESSESFFVDMLDDIAATISSCQAIEKALDEFFASSDAPSTRAIVVALEDCRSAINHIAKHRLPVADIVTPDESSAGDASSPTASTNKAAGSTASVIANALVSRDAAFKQLLEIAQFFRKTEPHSPVSYALEK